MHDKNFYYSLVTGEVVEIRDYEIPTLFNYQIPLKSRPKSSCNACYGRGHNGKNNSGIFTPCKCVSKVIDTTHFKGDNVSVYLPRLLNK